MFTSAHSTVVPELARSEYSGSGSTLSRLKPIQSEKLAGVKPVFSAVKKQISAAKEDMKTAVRYTFITASVRSELMLASRKRQISAGVAALCLGAPIHVIGLPVFGFFTGSVLAANGINLIQGRELLHQSYPFAEGGETPKIVPDAVFHSTDVKMFSQTSDVKNHLAIARYHASHGNTFRAQFELILADGLCDTSLSMSVKEKSKMRDQIKHIEASFQLPTLEADLISKVKNDCS